MALVIEDGTCVADADSFVSLADADAHFVSYGGFWTGDDPDKEAALRRAALWLSTYIKWHGTKTCTGRLAWPRSGVSDCEGVAIADNAIPYQVVFAQLAAASLELQSPGALTPNITPGGQVLREKVDVIEVTYMTPEQQGLAKGTVNPIDAQRQVLTQVNDMIRCLASVGPNVPWPFVV